MNQLVIFLSIVSLECDWERRRTPQSDDLKCEHSTRARARARGCGVVCLVWRARCRVAVLHRTAHSMAACGHAASPAGTGPQVEPRSPLQTCARHMHPLCCADLPTIFPADSLLSMRPRTATKA